MLRSTAIAILGVVAYFIACTVLVVTHHIAYKHGRHVMYAETVAWLGVDETHIVLVGNHAITHKGIDRLDKVKAAANQCTLCHGGTDG